MYLTNPQLPDSKYFNSSGRAYPDISALAGNIPTAHCVCVCVGV